MMDVLVAEDDLDARRMVRVALENAGYMVFEATDGKAARMVLHQSPCPMAVVLDADLPRVSAQAILTEAAADGALAHHAYVLVTSERSNQLSPALAALVARLAVPVLRTPFTIETLVETVGQAARRVSPAFPAD
jgi:CheY-like chemotaxis protein